jgi:hypothetical protein
MKKSLLFTLLALLVSFACAQVVQAAMPTQMKRQAVPLGDVGSRDTHWQPIDPPGSTGMTATIIGYVEIDGVEQQSPLLEVGIFHEDECRGADFVSVYIPNQNRYFLYCSFFGLYGEDDHFRIYDHATETELDVFCPQTITYSDNATYGLPDPYLISFFSNHFEILATADPEAGGNVSGSGLYERDATATLSASPNDGYSFVNWTKETEVVSNDPVFSFIVTPSSAGAYVAHFDVNSYLIEATANPSTGGTIAGTGVYSYGSTATLAATPATGYHFVNWTKNGMVVSTSANYSFVVDGPATLVANFALNSYEITAAISPSHGGLISGAGIYFHGQTATLTITPGENYEFVNWTENDAIVSEDLSYSFTVTSDRNLVANLNYIDYLGEDDVVISIYPNPASSQLTIETSRMIDY